MLKKVAIAILLLSAYSLMLGHNIVPHGHFDEVVSKEFDNNSNKESDPDHSYPLSHSVTLHTIIIKQNITPNYIYKCELKKSISTGDFSSDSAANNKSFISSSVRFPIPVFKLARVTGHSLYSRPPPVS